ncbi:pilus assembly PilX family protein [Thalassolituus sp. UBA2009]|jgi:hypothetical protein|uniref:pilus assembly PilX family protein n=1 Tax=Thalassolituus sp. UBA2009 TaxID=1947658 RepID=UPI000C5DB503|nr:hypothetical protein [Thalassolituus sp. UBA2009]MAY14069.1 hypothetical protein [Oceanospirillaceae bacterium]|tara:strand:+ start:215 stop:769 length:555 start_codon:yes stop_codon:yes gene_type:complete
MNSRFRHQKGSALLVSLAVLTAITLGAMVAMQRSTVQIRMISNLQHQQEITNATLGTLNYLYDQMENNGALQNDILIKAESLYKASLADPATNTSFNPFTEFKASLTQPSFNSKSISTGGITASARNLPVPPGTSFYLKGKGGCGNGCSVMHAALNVSTVSTNGAISESQEIGVRRLIPGGTGQ